MTREALTVPALSSVESRSEGVRRENCSSVSKHVLANSSRSLNPSHSVGTHKHVQLLFSCVLMSLIAFIHEENVAAAAAKHYNIHRNLNQLVDSVAYQSQFLMQTQWTPY